MAVEVDHSKMMSVVVLASCAGSPNAAGTRTAVGIVVVVVVMGFLGWVLGGKWGGQRTFEIGWKTANGQV